MKIKQLLSCVFCFFALQSRSQQSDAQWEWLNPKPAGYTNTKVYFSDANNGFIFNDNGDLIRTTDGGASWTIQQHFANAKAMDLKDSTGIIAGFSNHVYVSNNNGSSWVKKTIDNNTNPYFPFVQVVSRDTLIALNSNNSILYRSTDRGATWNVVLTNVLLNNNRSFYFVNSKIGFIGSFGKINKTVDGGLTWQQQNIGGSWAIRAIRFLDENLGFASTEDSKLLKTTNGGLTWTSSNNLFRVSSFFFINANIIYAGGEQGKIYKTVDGGLNWSIVSPTFTYGGYSYNSIHFVNADKGFAVGVSGQILATSNAGATWHQHAVTHLEMTSFCFRTKQVGYATDWWSVYKTTDAGQTWQAANFTLPNTNNRFTHSWFRNKDTGFVVSRDPVRFYKTYNGGQTWQAVYPFPSGYDYTRAMDFVNDTTGYICMDNTTATQLFKTTNGGETWTYIGFYYIPFTKLEFVTGSTGYGVAYHDVYKTTDSAKTWQVIDGNNSDWVNGVHFVSPLKGYSYGDNGFMKKTVDGGQTWSKVNVPYGHITTMHFFDEQRGYLASETYNIGVLKTYDGGTTWHHVLNRAPKFMHSSSDTIIYVAGYEGAILRQKVPGYFLDSVRVSNITYCSADFSAYVSVAFGSIDSIWLEYGTTSFSNSVAVNPFSVSNSSVRVTKKIQDLAHGETYIFRLKCSYKGNFIYSDEFSFKTLIFPKPVITVIGDSLISSYARNNQWFLNGQAIAGATGRTLKVSVSGDYTLQVIESGCLSPMSDITHIDLVLENSLVVYPNPTTNFVYLKHDAAVVMDVTLQDLYGRVLFSTRSMTNLTKISLANLPRGVYLITIRESTLKQTITRKVLKL